MKFKVSKQRFLRAVSESFNKPKHVSVDFSTINLVKRKEREQISRRYIIYAEIKHLSCDERGVTAAIYKLSGHRYSLLLRLLKESR